MRNLEKSRSNQTHTENALIIVSCQVLLSQSTLLSFNFVRRATNYAARGLVRTAWNFSNPYCWVESPSFVMDLLDISSSCATLSFGVKKKLDHDTLTPYILPLCQLFSRVAHKMIERLKNDGKCATYVWKNLVLKREN